MSDENAAVATPSEPTPNDGEPRCRCGHDRGHLRVSKEEEYSFFSTMLVVLGISQKPLRIKYRCRRCNQQIGPTEVVR